MTTDDFQGEGYRDRNGGRAQRGTGSITALLGRHNVGDTRAADALMREVGPELVRLAQNYLRKERSNHTLDAQSLVHETYLRLATQRNVLWKNRGHFYGVAAQTMRRILCDYARHRNSIKRGGPAQKIRLSVNDLGYELIRQETINQDERIEIDAALTRLATRDPVGSAYVQLRFFEGFTLDEASEILEIPSRTLSRKWRIARAWLINELKSS